MPEEDKDQHELPHPDSPERKLEQNAPAWVKDANISTMEASSLKAIQQSMSGMVSAQELLNQIADSSVLNVSRLSAQQMGTMQSVVDLMSQQGLAIRSLFSINLALEPWTSTMGSQGQMLNNVNALYDTRSVIDNFLNSQTLRATQDMLEAYRALSTAPLTEALDGLRVQTDWVQRLDLASPSLAALSDGLTQALNSPRYRIFFEGSFADDLLEQLSAADLAPSMEEKAQCFSNLLLWLEQKMKEYPPSRIAYTAFVHLFIPLIFLYLGQLYGEYRDQPWERQHSDETREGFAQVMAQTQSEDAQHRESHVQIETHIQALSNQLMAYQAAAEAASEGRPEYEVVRQVIVREEPYSGSDRVTVLQPGSEVEEIHRQGKWLYVEYFDYIEGGLKFGWIYKRHLVLIEREE